MRLKKILVDNGIEKLEIEIDEPYGDYIIGGTKVKNGK